MNKEEQTTIQEVIEQLEELAKKHWDMSTYYIDCAKETKCNDSGRELMHEYVVSKAKIQIL